MNKSLFCSLYLLLFTFFQLIPFESILTQIRFGALIPSSSVKTEDTWIVFGSFRGGDFSSSVYRIRPDGSGETLISRHPGGRPNSLDPSVCPDGRILFTRGGGDHRESIWIMNGDGSGERELISGVGLRFGGGHALPSISTDGKTLLYVHAKSRQDTSVYTRALDGGEPKPLGPGRYPAWSPDGKVALVRDVDGTDQVFATEGQALKQITFGPGATYPSWSPDGQSLVFCQPTGGKLDIFILSLSSGEPRQLTFTADQSEKEPTWSPDGRWIAFTKPPPDAPDGWQKSIFLIPVEGGPAKQITGSRFNDTRPTWMVMP